MRLRALIFDVDGTLADTEEAHRNAFNGAFARHGYSWHWDAATYRRLLQVAGGKERIAYFIHSLQLPLEREAQCLLEIPALHETKTTLYTHAVSRGAVRLRSGVARLIAEARAQHLQLAIATTTAAVNVSALLENTLGDQAESWFGAVVTGESVAHKKPAPDAFARVLELLGRDALECVAFEDSRNGVLASTACGIPTVVTPCQWTDDHQFGRMLMQLPELGDPEHPLSDHTTIGLSQPWLTLGDLEQALQRA
jgi:HAD superfamily hydrolase (TIGR01509 family)